MTSALGLRRRSEPEGGRCAPPRATRGGGGPLDLGGSPGRWSPAVPVTCCVVRRSAGTHPPIGSSRTPPTVQPAPARTDRRRPPGGTVRLTYSFDPTCPWTWLTSRWLVRAAELEGHTITWRPLSLAHVHADETDPSK